MKTIVVTGGTDGIGRSVAEACLARGDRVLVVGASPGKGAAFLAAAAGRGAGGRARFARADLSLLEENRRILGLLAGELDALDALVLCARYHRSARAETADGFEATFALFYLSRYLLGHGLLPLLERAERPVIANVAGPGGTAPVQWADLQLARGYRGTAALGHGGRLNDLLGAAFAGRHPAARTRYVLFNPGVVATSFAGQYDQATAVEVARLAAAGKPAGEAAAPVIACIDDPPAAPLSAFVEGRPHPLDRLLFDPADAARLDAITQQLLARHPA
jgi:NAD(P)-dependent dehydrogenase (short-subunit alcohol dehydrogenase family)